jgi:putative heme-binding domain-containing protein
LKNPPDEYTEGLLTALLEQDEIAELAGEILRADRSTHAQAIVIHSIANSARKVPHASWLEPLREQILNSDDSVSQNAFTAVSSLTGAHFSNELQAVSESENRPIALRMDAMSVLCSGTLSEDVLDQLLRLYQESGSPTAASRAAQIIGGAKLSRKQLVRITPLFSHASPAQLRELIRGFQRSVAPEEAIAFLDSIASADALMSLSETELSDVIKRFPPETLDRANRLLDRLKQHQQQKLVRLESLRNHLADGNAERGKSVFASEKAKCSSCHRIGKMGTPVGPDLTTIGSNRSANDLLESIVFPSASIVRDYESYVVLTVEGRAIAGLVLNESADAIEIQQTNGEKVRLQQSDIERITPSTVSIMPAGLEEALSEADLLDVVKYLQSLR